MGEFIHWEENNKRDEALRNPTAGFVLQIISYPLRVLDSQVNLEGRILAAKMK